MKSKFTHEEKQAILDRYISKSESPTSVIEIIKKANVLPNAPLQQKLCVAEKLSSEYTFGGGFQWCIQLLSYPRPVA